MKNSNYGLLFSNSKGTNRLLHVILFISVLSSCTVSRQIGKQANNILLQDSIVGTSHVGISIYEPATNTYLYIYNADKYFIPASNVKLFTLYAGMKYLGDSLAGLRYYSSNLSNQENPITIEATGDPTFLHPDFLKQPVFNFLKNRKEILLSTYHMFCDFGKGWAWDDYQEAFMPSRSNFPIYGNLISIHWYSKDSISILPKYFDSTSKKLGSFGDGFSAARTTESNRLLILEGKNKTKSIPFYPDINTVIDLLHDTFPNIDILITAHKSNFTYKEYSVINSQPTDSLLKPMMHNSDNFFAEQTLLMASNEHLGYMNDEAIIDTLLKSNFKDIPQQPRWVDGSGLSRYNLFTPESFIYILNKLKNEFGWERLKVILPTGGQGSLKNYYHSDSGFIFAKTGSMSNQVALSGYLITKKNKFLIFSVLVNNEMGNAAHVRREIEKFIKGIRNKY